MSKSGTRRAIKMIARDAGIRTRVTPHTLQQCHVTHLLERGLSMPQIQEQLGHARVETTLICTELTDLTVQNANSLINQII